MADQLIPVQLDDFKNCAVYFFWDSDLAWRNANRVILDEAAYKLEIAVLNYVKGSIVAATEVDYPIDAEKFLIRLEDKLNSEYKSWAELKEDCKFSVTANVFVKNRRAIFINLYSLKKLE